jgi:hypothetical protein
MEDTEILQCERDGEDGFKCGELGFCHIGLEAWQDAVRDQKKLLADERLEDPLPLPKTAEELEAERLALITEGEAEAEAAKLALIEEQEAERLALEAEALAFEEEKLLNP